MKYLKITPDRLFVSVIIALAISLRILLIYLGWPGVNSDEGTMGLMALHIAYHGELPLFFYGQGYTGSLEAFLGAVFFRFFGPSAFALRLGVILMFGLFLASMYLLTNLLYTKKEALGTLLLLSLGSSQIMSLELGAIGNYPETLLFSAVLLLLASWLALTSNQGLPGRNIKSRYIGYGCFGCVIGLALWSDVLILPFIVMASLLLIVFCRADMGKRGLLCLLAGLVIGLTPVFVYNASVPLNQGTLSVLGTIFGFTNSGQLISQPSLVQKIMGTILIGIPNMTGANPLCPISAADAWPLSVRPTPHVLQCTVVRGIWGLGFLVLLAVAAFLAGRDYGKAWHLPAASAGSVEEKVQREVAIRSFARCMFLGSAVLTLAIFAVSFAAGSTPWPSARYLIGLLIALPAVLSPLWGNTASVGTGLAPVRKRVESTLRAVWPACLKYGILLLVGTAFLLGTISIFPLIPDTQGVNRQQAALIDDLLHISAPHIYTDYWTCDRIAFQSREDIICSVLDEQLQSGTNRYLPYDSIVRADPHSAYVFPIDSPQATAMALRATASNAGYQRFVFDGYVIYQPV
jgi:hypothetical protein